MSVKSNAGELIALCCGCGRDQPTWSKQSDIRISPDHVMFFFHILFWEGADKTFHILFWEGPDKTNYWRAKLLNFGFNNWGNNCIEDLHCLGLVACDVVLIASDWDFNSLLWVKDFINGVHHVFQEMMIHHYYMDYNTVWYISVTIQVIEFFI